MTAEMGPGEAREVPVSAYIYLYLMVTMVITRRQQTNIDAAVLPRRPPY